MSVVLAVFLLTRLVERPELSIGVDLCVDDGRRIRKLHLGRRHRVSACRGLDRSGFAAARRSATALAYRIVDRGGGVFGAAAGIAFHLRPATDGRVARRRHAVRCHALSGLERRRDQGDRTFRQSAGFLVDLSCRRTSSILSHGCVVADLAAEEAGPHARAAIGCPCHLRFYWPSAFVCPGFSPASSVTPTISAGARRCRRSCCSSPSPPSCFRA